MTTDQAGLKYIIQFTRLSIVRASLWLMGSVSACGLIVFVLAVTSALIVNGTTPKFMVEGPSMQPTFYTGDMLQLEPFKSTSKLQHGDIIVFHVPGQPASEPAYVKRVIGLPGETVEIRNTKVYINGMELDEPYIAEPCDPTRCIDRVWQLGSGDYFVMGDNRNHSSDSRAYGSIGITYIIAKVLSVADTSIISAYNTRDDAIRLTVTAIVATNKAVETLISATSTAAAPK